MRYDVVVIGASWGALRALRKILSDLPRTFELPLILVPHRGRDSEHLLAHLLKDCSDMPVTEVEDKDAIEPGHVYLAPSNYHLLVDDDAHFSLTTDEPVRFSRPSIDVTFESVADVYGPRSVGVVLTGANEDGSRGLRRIADRGGLAIVQDPATAESPLMPASALKMVPEALMLPLDGIADHLATLEARTPRFGSRA
jgi:two-component system, chemotaxis family, protein-glutamate methylesterase/glutaminase